MAVRRENAGRCFFVLNLQDVTKNCNFNYSDDDAYVGDEIIKTGNWVPIRRTGCRTEEKTAISEKLLRPCSVPIPQSAAPLPS